MRDMIGMLLGRRAAIERIAGAGPAMLLFGLLLTLTAGLARDYDQVNLLRWPWLRLAPPLSSFLITGWVFIFIWRRLPRDIPRGRQFLSLLTLVWLTSPLAWLYAIPVERFLPEAAAGAAKIAFLLLVAVWRVTLITRFACVLARRDAAVVSTLVLMPLQLVAIPLVWTVLVETVGFMARMRLSVAKQMLASTTEVILTGLVWTLPVVFVAWIVTAARSPRARRGADADAPAPPPPPPPSDARPAWLLLAGAAVTLAALIAWAQPAQQHRSEVRSLIGKRSVEPLLTWLAEHPPDSLPSGWHIFENPDVVPVAEALAERLHRPRPGDPVLHAEYRARIYYASFRRQWPVNDPRPLIELLRIPEGRAALGDDSRALDAARGMIDQLPADARDELQKLLD